MKKNILLVIVAVLLGVQVKSQNYHYRYMCAEWNDGYDKIINLETCQDNSGTGQLLFCIGRMEINLRSKTNIDIEINDTPIHNFGCIERCDYSNGVCEMMNDIQVDVQIHQYSFNSWSSSGIDSINLRIMNYINIDFSGLNNVQSLTSININDDSYQYSSENGIIYDKDKTTLIYCPAGKTEISLPKTATGTDYRALNHTSWYKNQPDGVVYLNDMLYGYKGTMPENTSIEVREGTTSINSSAFSNQKNLISIKLPASVTSVGSSAFGGCSELVSITIPDNLTNIPASAFNNTGWYKNQLDGVVYLNNLLFGYKGTMPENTSIDVKEGTTSINSYAFSNKNNLTSIKLLESLTSIGNSAFYRCTELTSVIIPENVTSIGSSAFEGCNKLTSVVIPEKVTTIGNYAFRSCAELTSVVIPKNVTTIENGTFSGCTGLDSVVIPDNVTSIGSSAFYNCSSLTSIKLPESLTSIESSAFNGCSKLTSVVIPENVTSIGSSAFVGCSELVSISIPDNLTTIPQNALNNTGWYNNQPDGVVYLNNLLFGYKGTMPENTSINVREGTISINSSAFSNKNNLISIKLPESITRIGSYAFYSCSGLTSIIIPENVTSIENYTFNRCSGLTSVVISENVTNIGDYAFYYCTGLTSVVIPEKVTNIGRSAFYVCSGLTSINIPENVTSIGDYTFSSCSKLTSVVIPKNVTSIGRFAFSSCSELTSVVIPEKVASIENYAFGYCRKLTSIVNYSPTPTPISPYSYVFSDVNKNTCILYVPAGSVKAYRAATGWKDFVNIIELPTISEEDIDITPSDTTALIEWQSYENAEGYRLIIYSNEIPADTLEFDAEGKFRSVSTTFSHTIENLSSSTDYYYTFEILGINNVVLASQSGEFTTKGEPTGIVETQCIASLPIITGYYSITGTKLSEEPKTGLYIILYSNGLVEKRINK